MQTPITGPTLLCSTGAFTRENGLSDHKAILEYGPLLDVDGIEVIFYTDWYEDDLFQKVADDLRASGTAFPVVHAEKSIGSLLSSPDPGAADEAIRRLNINCYFAQRIGAETLVLHLWGMPESDRDFHRNLDQLSLCTDFAWRYRLWLAVETLPCLQRDPLLRIQQILERDSRCVAALDTEFLAFHDQLDASIAADWLWADGRARHIHIKDYDGTVKTDDGVRRHLQPGDGNIDFHSFFRGLRERNFTGSISLEASALMPDGTVNMERLQNGLRRLRDLMPRREEHKIVQADIA